MLNAERCKSKQQTLMINKKQEFHIFTLHAYTNNSAKYANTI